MTDYKLKTKDQKTEDRSKMTGYKLNALIQSYLLPLTSYLCPL